LQTTLRSFGQQTTNISNLNVERCLKLSLPLPPVHEQRRIADVLDRAEALRAKRRATLLQLDTLTQAIFLDMFGDPVKGERGWPTDTIAGISAKEQHAIVDGPFGSSLKADDYRDSGIPVIRIANISKDGFFVPSNLLHIDRALFESLQRSKVRQGDVLISRVGTIGNTCVYPEGRGDALLSTTGVCKITVDRTRTSPVFLHAALRMPAFQAQIQRSASTSVQKYFNLTALRGWSIVVPPLGLQHDFARTLAAVEMLRVSQDASLSSLDDLFSSLQHRAFRGEL
jgi:type I restriction enzyme S subunit